jgi:predicted nuclease with TOPRIM domain
MDMELVLKQLQDTATVMAGLQARQAAVLKDHSEWLEQHQTFIAKHEETMANHEQMMARHDRVMAEIEDKLNGLIGYVDSSRKPE